MSTTNEDMIRILNFIKTECSKSENAPRYSKPYAPLPFYFISDVIFSGKATVVLWMDGTKTVVKCAEGDYYNPYHGLYVALLKKTLGTKGLKLLEGIVNQALKKKQKRQNKKDKKSASCSQKNIIPETQKQ